VNFFLIDVGNPGKVISSSINNQNIIQILYEDPSSNSAKAEFAFLNEILSTKNTI